MNEALVVSNVVLWVIVVALAGVVVALARQIGVLYERVAPAGALAIGKGPGVGELAPVVTAATLDGAAIEIGAADPTGRRTLLFFVSPTCPVCKTLLPVVRAMARGAAGVGGEGSGFRLILASDGEAGEHREFAARQGIADLPYVLSAALGVAWKVPRLPYAVLLDARGVVRARGLVNTREHLESLLEADETGIATIQEYIETQTMAAEAAAVGESHPQARSHR